MRWLDDRELAGWRGLQRLRGPLAAALNRQLTQDSGLSNADYEVLVVLSELEDGVLRVGELGRMTGWEKSRLSHHLKRMQNRGLISRRECSTDGRGAFVEITPVGRQAIGEAAPGHVAAVRRLVVDLLTPAELDALAAIGDKVNARLAAEGCCETDGE